MGRHGLISATVIVQTLIITLATAVFGAAQAASITPTPSPTPKPKPTPLQPYVTELKGLSPGVTPDQVKEKLGKPQVEDKTGMFYSLSDGESVQVGLDPKGKVRTIALIFSGDEAGPPKFEDIFGPDTRVTTKKDGSVYKLIRYPAAGFWIAYSRTVAGKKPMTTITMRKIVR